MTERPDDAALRAAWRRAAADEAIDLALRTIYAHVAEEVRRRKPLCIASGRCCGFERFGHLLYVTGLETAWCVQAHAARIGVALTIGAVDEAVQRGDCPFLIEGRLCGAHLERPLGCRIYFCDRSATWQEELHERLHREIAGLHERCAIPYRYGEWRAMLRMVAEA